MFLSDVRIPANQPIGCCRAEISTNDVAWLLHHIIFPAVACGAAPVAVTYREVPFTWQITDHGIGILCYHGDPRRDERALNVLVNLHRYLAQDMGDYTLQIRFAALDGGDC